MRVAIIAPPYPLEEIPAPPLGVTYVAAAFESAGAEVRIFDYIVTRYSPEKLKAQLDEFQPQLVGATSVTLNFPGAAEIIKVVKGHNPDIVTVMGGPHVSFTAETTLRTYPEIDLLVLGEGEATIAELMGHGMNQRSWPDIRGLAFCSNGSIMMTGHRDFIDDLDALPLPARHLLPLSRYQALGYPISIITGRGCPYACIFCQGRRMVGKRIRQRKASLVVDEIQHILSYGIDRINVADDLFASDKDKVREICEEIRRRDIRFTWSAFARVNTVDRETLELMRDAGCDSVSFGVETGNPEMLKRIKKGITLDQVRHAVNLCKDVGLIAHTSFMAGLPGESPATLRETKAFAASLGSLYGYHILAPFPGTTVREEADKYDLEILTDDWSRYDANSAVTRTSQLSPEEINRFVAEYDREVDAEWEKQLRSYHEGTSTPEEDLRVEGHFRTQLIFKILSEDMIESAGIFPVDAIENDSTDLLCQRIQKMTSSEPALIKKTIEDLIHKGFIRTRKRNGHLAWYWTLNNRE